MLDADPQTFSDFVSELFEKMDPATRAHVLVAYQNFIPIIGALQGVARREGKDFSLNNFIADCSRNQSTGSDEINSRRYAWFTWAGLIYRMSGMANGNESIKEVLAEIWCEIARAAPLLKGLLPDNIVWKEEEKVYFDQVLREHDRDCIVWAINHAAPRIIWKSPAIADLAKENELFYFDGGGSMGPLSYIPPRAP
jgi:hypothetical protein